MAPWVFVRVTRLNAFVGLLGALIGALWLAVWLALLSASPADTLYLFAYLLGRYERDFGVLSVFCLLVGKCSRN